MMADAEAKPSDTEARPPAVESDSAPAPAPAPAPPATTTISTISLQSGDTRLVIALLQSRERLQLKVLEVTPEITLLGSTLAEALALQRQHEEVLLQLQNKQSPVEELLRQADQLIATQRPRAEVYAAMAESLGIAWKDVNSHLDLRKTILELNVAYHSRAEECIEQMLALEKACNNTNVPIEIDAVKNLMGRLHDLRRLMLESLMITLQEGRTLLEKMKEIAAQGTLDSRPGYISTPASYTVSQVEHWLEDLHDRRKLLDMKWQNRKTQLERCLSLVLLAKDLKDLEETLAIRKESLHRSNDQLGDSSSSAELLLHEHRKFNSEAREFQDRCLKITKSTENLKNSGHFAGEQATAQAYAVLNSCAEYIDALEQRENILNRAIAFFRSAHTTLTKLDQLEIQLTTTELSFSNPNLVQLHSQAIKALEEITGASLQEGYALLDIVGLSAPGAEGVKRTVGEIESRKIRLDSLCTAHQEENLHLSRALTSFLETQNELYSWLVSIAEAFLQGHQDMGSVFAMAEDFLFLHQQLLSDLQNKGIEIKEVLLTLPPILERLNNDQRFDIDEKVDALHSHWLKLKTVLETRTDLATLYVKFHSLAVDLANEFDAIDVEFKKITNAGDQEMMRNVERKWLDIQQLNAQLGNVGKSFIEQCMKSTDPYLDVKRAVLCVETLLEHFGSRQLVITESWQTWQTNITIEREFKVLWERNTTESNKTIDWVSKLDDRLYPILTGESTTSKVIVKDLEEKLQLVLPEFKKAQAEIELRVKTAENLAQKGDTQGGKDAIVNQLIELHSKLNTVVTEYQVLIQMVISFLKNVSELEKIIENLQSQYHITRLPNAAAEVDLLIKEHEASKHAVLELFRFTQNESEQIIQRINKQEPENAAHHDVEVVRRLLQIKKMAWESAWADRKLLLQQHYQLCQFDSDLQQINSSLSDLSKQLIAIRGQYGESLASAKATSVAFVYFEKTIQLLETRIETFVNTAEHMLKSDHSSQHVEKELSQLQSKLAAFNNQVTESRRLIDLSIKYFTLVEEAEEWFHVGSKLLVSIARKSTAVKTFDEATLLLNEVDTFLKTEQAKQRERIDKISNIALDLYGAEGSKQITHVVHENKEMVDSLNIISEELSVLAKNLKATEKQYQTQSTQKDMEETDAILTAAKAEAAAAKAAATAAQEARRAAEAAAKALQEATPVIEKMTVETISSEIFETENKEIVKLRKSPSPPHKKAKVTNNDELPKPIAPIFTSPLQDAAIQEGERFTFECCVTGLPMPEVIWYKDNIPIQNNPDYQTSYHQGMCKLTIEETFTEDSARFSCKAFNQVGTAETNATLSVKEAEPEEQLVAPVFTKKIQPGSAKEGSSFHLECTVEGNPLPIVQWYKNDVCIDNSPDYVITYNNGEAVLKFEEIFLEDQAEYSCKAKNPLGTAICTAQLTVEPLEPTEVPVFTIPLSNVMARAGRKIKLECEVTGLPQPELSWCHNGKIIKETRDIKLQYENGKGTLIINEAFPKDAGTYIVIAKNIAGEATCSSNVSVKGRLPTETSDSEIASDIEPVKPSIQLPLKDLSVFEGKQVLLECIIVGQPEPEVIWYHNNRPVKESSDFQLLFQGDRCSLVICEAYLEDAGEYKVVAINSAGEAFSKCDLKIQALGESEPAVRPQTQEICQMPLGTPPKFNKLLCDTHAIEGENVILECIVIGYPKPSIKWFFNDQEILDVTKKQYYEDAEGNASLTLLEVTLQDQGVYSITAANSFGKATCTINLSVKAKPFEKPPPAEQIEQNYVAPSFKEIFTDKIVHENEEVTFECVVDGQPTPKVSWMFNYQPISEKDFVASTNGEKQNLKIQNVKKMDQGIVTCVAENDAGRTSCTGRLNVVESNIPSEVSCAHESVTEQSGSSSYIMKKSVYMQTSSQMSSSFTTTEVSPNSPSIQKRSDQTTTETCQSPLSKGLMKKDVHQESWGKERIEQSSIKIPSGGEDTESSASCYSTPFSSPRPLRKSIPPRFLSPLCGKIVDQGADVILEGIIDGYPQPNVSWTKNDKELIPLEGKVSIKNDHKKVEVVLTNVSTKDGGKYTCKIDNSMGSATSTADVVVKKTIFPPVFGRRLQAQTVKEGERVVMEVEVTGTPDPVITWYMDGQQIFSGAPELPFRIKSQGNCYSLIIEKASLGYSGKYSVKAVNSGGEAQSTADFIVYKVQSEIESQRQVVCEDIGSKEKLSHPSTPVSEAQSEIKQTSMKTPPPTISVIDQVTPVVESKYISESRVVRETTQMETHMSIKLEHTPSPLNFEPIISQRLQKQSLSPEQKHDENETKSLSPVQSNTFVTNIQQKSKLEETEENVQGQKHSENVGLSASKETKQEIPPETMKIILETKIPNDSKQCVVTDIPIISNVCRQDDISSSNVNTSDSTDNVVESGVETSSVSKKAAFEFFENILKENQEENQKHIKELVKLPKREIIQTFCSSSLPEKESQSFTKTEVRSNISDISGITSVSETVSSQLHSESSSSTKFVKKIIHNQHPTSDSLLDEFNLQPEPPPEIGFIPKSDANNKYKEDVTSRAKKLEESHKVLSSSEIPSGAVCIFPSPIFSETQIQKQEHKIPVSVSNVTNITHSTEEETIKTDFVENFSSENKERFPIDKIQLTKAPKEQSVLLTECKSKDDNEEKSHMPLEQKESKYIQEIREETSQIIKISSPTPQKTYQYSPLTISAVHRSDSPSEPEVFSEPMQQIQTNLQSHTSNESTKEEMWTPCPSQSEQNSCNTNYLMEQTCSTQRPVSPRPSTEGLAMEKLWIPKKSPTSELIMPKHKITPHQPERAVSPKPSMEGLAMDKIWAHKHPDSNLRKVWPPVQNTEEKPIIPWTIKTAAEKVWPPSETVSSQRDESETESKNLEVNNIEKSQQSSPPQVTVMKHSEETTVVNCAKDIFEKQSHYIASSFPEKIQRTELPLPPPQNSTIQTQPLPLASLAELKIPHSFPPEENQPLSRPQTNVILPAEVTSNIEETRRSPFPTKPVETPNVPSPVPSLPLVPPVRNEGSGPSSSVTHYIAQANVIHSSAILESEILSSQTMTTTITRSEIKEDKQISSEINIFSGTKKEGSPVIVEERNIKPSESKRSWPPEQHIVSETNSTTVSQVPLNSGSQEYRHSLIDATPKDLAEPYLEPGPPPEIGFAHPPQERRQSYVELIEQDLEKDLEKEPSRHLVGAVRTIPPPPLLAKENKDISVSCKKEQKSIVRPIIAKKETKKIDTEIQTKPFERFPDLEPFPFKPDSPKEKPTRYPPPPKPSKFIKGDFTGSDYESDLESTHIPPKWRPYESDTEELSYRRVRPPSYIQPKRPKSTEPEPLPPSRFEKPLQTQGSPRPVIDKCQISKKECKSVVSKKTNSSLQTKALLQTKSTIQYKNDKTKKQPTTEPGKKHSPPLLKPGSPPQFITSIPPSKNTTQTPENSKTETNLPPKSKPDSPKSKLKTAKSDFPESGYMADTDEPRHFKHATHKSMNETKTIIERSAVSSEIISQHSTQTTTQIQTQTGTKIEMQQADTHQQHQQHRQPLVKSTIEKSTSVRNQSLRAQHKYSESKLDKKVVTSVGSAKSKKDLISISTSTPTATQTSVQEEPKLLPFPFKPDPVANRTFCMPPPSPSKFVKGEFRESDHESDYDCRIPVKWKPADSDVDEPTYRPVRPVLTPKPLLQTQPSGGRTPTPPTEFDHPPDFGGPPRPKFEPIDKPTTIYKTDKYAVKPQKVFKPKPVTPRTVPPMEVVIATPAIKPVTSVILEPGSPPEIRYAPPTRTKLKGPLENATQIETSKVMNYSESSEHSHRVVNVQHTTRVITFGDKENKASENVIKDLHEKKESHIHRSKCPPPTQPKKFVPGEFRESDYESDIESMKIKPKWTPGNSDTDEPHYRRVRPPQITQSVPAKSLDSCKPLESVPSAHICSTEKITSSSKVTDHVTSVQQLEAEQRRLQRVEEMKKKFSGVDKPETKRFPIEIGSKSLDRGDFNLQPGEPPQFDYAGTKIAKEASFVANKHMSEMSDTFKSKAQKFVSDIMTDVASPRQIVPSEKTKSTVARTEKDKKAEDDPQAYREESRVAEYGTKHIDPDTGLIYFKYDFGYEFGIVLPNENKRPREGSEKNTQITPKRSDDIEVPVIHEKTASESEDPGNMAVATKSSLTPNKVPQFRPKKFTHFKSVKWEPASESEMSEAEGDTSLHRKRNSIPQSHLPVQKEPHIHIPPTRWEAASPSPLSLSLSPSLPSLSPHTGATLDFIASPAGSWQGLSPNKSQQVGHPQGFTPTPPSTPSTPGNTPAPMVQLRKPPIFITPLRNIAVMVGNSARFECIVQAEPLPNILWAKDGRLIENSKKHQIHFRNGVCRLTIPQAFQEDVGCYSCTATNMVGTNGTSGSLQVSGEKYSEFK